MVLADPDSAVSRSDDTTLIVGSDGEPLSQSLGDLVISTVPADERDFDLDADLVAAGGVTFGPFGLQGVGEIAGGVNSTDNNGIEVAVDWLSGDDEVLFTRTFGGSDTDRVQLLDVSVFSDRAQIRVEDASGAQQNNVRGTFHIHP